MYRRGWGNRLLWILTAIGVSVPDNITTPSMPTIFPSAGPTVLSPIGVVVWEDVCSFGGCAVSAFLGQLENANHIISASLKVEFKGEFSETNEFADLVLNDVKVTTCRPSTVIDCPLALETCTEIIARRRKFLMYERGPELRHARPLYLDL